ncbi:MAG TPA: hypothetical protein VGF28_21655 [Thermoanaerobaculia bacterium]
MKQEDVSIRTGLKAGDDGSQIGSGNAAGNGQFGSGNAAGNGQIGSGS